MLGRRLEDARIVRAERVGSRFHAHSVKLTREAELDDQLLRWLAEAYELKGRPHSP